MAPPLSSRQFSTKSLTILANNVTSHLPTNTLENFLAALSAIDEEIHSELTRTRAELSVATTELTKERALRQAAEARLGEPPSPENDPTPVLPDPGRLRDASPSALLDLLLAREDAFRHQSALVDRLKEHNSQLREAYQKLSNRIKASSSNNEDENTTKVSDNPSCNAGRTTGTFRQSCGTDSCDAAAAELLKTIAIQQRAHEKLRTTVAELTKELERIDPRKVRETERLEENLRVTEQRLSETEVEMREKDTEIVELKKQLKKVLAEYEAVSVAHSYSNAELSKIRANGRGKGKHDRQTGDRLHAFGTGVENLLHSRKVHFR